MNDVKPINFDFNDVDEVNHRFAGNYIGFLDKKAGEVLPFQLNRMRGDSEFEGSMLKSATKRFSSDRFKYSHKDFDWNYPDLGYVNVDNIAVFLTRSSGRYYTRGLDSRFIKVRNAFVTELDILSVSSQYTGSQGKVLYSLFNRELPDFHTAVDSLNDSSYLARAFDRDWCIGIKQFSSEPVIYYKNNVVGYYSNGSAKLHTQSEFLKELLSVHTNVEIVADFGEIY